MSTPKIPSRVVRYNPNAQRAAAVAAAAASGSSSSSDAAPAIDEPPADWYALASLLLGVIGLMMRYKLCAWLALFASLGSIANMRRKDMDIKQVLSSLLFSVMSIAMNYFGNVKQGASIGERAAAGGLSAFF